jgi:replicative DNA helicase
VDQATRGLAPGEVCEIVARAGVGKTALLVNVAYNLSLKDMGPVLFFTMEMPIPRIFERTVQLACTVDADYVMSEARSAGEEPSGIFQQTVESFRNVWYVERDFLRYREIEAIVKASESKIGHPAAVLIDYLGRMRPDKSGQKPYEVTSELAQKLKHLAKACDVPVIYLHQASRSSAQDGSAPLTLDSGRDSGVTEEAADVVIGLWRPDLGEGAARDTEELEMAVLKARNGRGTRVRVVFLKSFMRMGEQEGSERRVIPMRRQRGERKSGTAT